MAVRTSVIDGDVSVGRNVAVGGRVDVAGRMVVGHDLRVDGWLEAPNIKGVNKGFFASLAELTSAYPVPQDGWLAGVGGSTPFAAYMASGGQWSATGGTISVEMDLASYDSRLDVVEGELEKAGEDLSVCADKIEALEADVAVTRYVADEAKSGAATCADKIEALEADVAGRSDELLRRLMGVSEHSVPYTDPFVLVKFDSDDDGYAIDKFNAWLDGLHTSGGETDTGKSGYFRVSKAGAYYDVCNIVFSWKSMVFYQVVRGFASVRDGVLVESDGYNVLQRKYDGSKWSAWTSGLDDVNTLVGRSVGIGELDTFFTGTHDALKGVVDGKTCGVWKVTSDTGYCCGMLEVWMDSSMHCITQRLVSNWLVNEGGVIDGSFHQHTVHEYYRLYNFSWSNGKLPDGTDWPVGSWSAWTEVQGTGSADLGEYLTRSEANGMYATGEALWQHQVEAESRMGNLEASADYLTRRVTALGTVYQAKGTVASVDALLELGKAAAGDVYNVVAGGTLGGKKYSAGTNFVCTTAFTSASDNKAGCWDALGGTFDLSGYLRGVEAAIMREEDAEGFLAHGVYPGAVTRHKTTATGSESSHVTWQVVECTPVTDSSGYTSYNWLRLGVNSPTSSSNPTTRFVVQYCSKGDTGYPAEYEWKDLNVYNQLDLQAAITRLGRAETNVSGALERVAALEGVVEGLEGRIAALEQSMTLILTNGVSE